MREWVGHATTTPSVIHVRSDRHPALCCHTRSCWRVSIREFMNVGVRFNLRRMLLELRPRERLIETDPKSSKYFHLLADLDAYEGDKRVYCKSWDEIIPRDYI